MGRRRHRGSHDRRAWLICRSGRGRTGNEGFAPEGVEIAAQERINDKFGDDTGSTIQVVIREGAGDVITVEGLETAIAVAGTIRSSVIGDLIVDSSDRPGVFHYLSTVEQTMATQGLTLAEMTDQMVKAFYAEAIDGDGEYGLDRVFAPINELGASAIDTSDNIIGDVVVSELTESQTTSLFITIAVAAVVLMISFHI